MTSTVQRVLEIDRPLTYKFSFAVNGATRTWIRATKPGPGYHQERGCQAIRIWQDGLVIVYGASWGSLFNALEAS